MPVTINQQILFALVGVNMLMTVLFSAALYNRQKKEVMSETDNTVRAAATLARETLPADFHDRITGPTSVSDLEFQTIVERNNRLCVSLGIEYIWSLMLADGKIVVTTSSSPDKIAEHRKHALFFEEHANQELYTSTFERMRPTYQSNHDKRGHVRVCLIPDIDAHGRKYLFGARFRLDKVDGHLRAVVRQAVSIGLTLFAVSMTIGYWITRRITRPIHELTSTIQGIAEGKRDWVAKERGSYEQVVLARQFNAMSRALQEKIEELEAARVQQISLHNSERKQVEEALMLSEGRYRGLLNFAVDGILVGSHEGVIIEANECICTLFGLARSEVIGKRIQEMPFTQESLRQAPFLYDRLKNGEMVVRERTIRRPDGSEVVIEMHTKMMADGTFQSIYRDVTERKRVDDSLKQVQCMLEEAQRMAKMGAWKYEVATGSFVWSDEVYRIHGVGRDFDINSLDTDVSFYIPEHRPIIKQAFLRAVEHAEPYDLELEFIRADGERIWTRASARPVIENGEVIRVDGNFMDITDRKRAEEDLRRNQEQLARQYEMVSTLLQNLAVGVFMVEVPSGKPLVANQEACRLMGWDALPDALAHELTAGFGFFRASDRTPYPLDNLPIRAGIRGERSHVDDVLVVRPDGVELLLEIFGTPVEDEQGRVWASLVSFSDISERKRVERAMRESEQRYRQLFEMESDALFLVENETCQVLDVNLAAQTLYGYSREELLSMRNFEVSAEPEKTRQLTRSGARLDSALSRRVFRRHRKKEGAVFPVEITATFFVMNGVGVHISAIRDITEHKKAQEVLESWNASLERRVAERTAEAETRMRQLGRLTGRLIQAEETERQRIADVLHEDLQQMLVAARMTLSVALEAVRNVATQEPLKRVDEMLSQSIRLTRTLVQEIAVPAVKEGDLPSAVEWIALQVQNKFGLKVTLTVDGEMEPVSESVYLCLFRAVQEILFNVVKHARVQEAEVLIQKAMGRSVRVTVRDRGCGFSAEALSAEGKAGSGVGLYGIRERIEGLGGQMEIANAPERGSTVILTVPSQGGSHEKDLPGGGVSGIIRL
jgi:PAS domain S-box-containing protein